MKILTCDNLRRYDPILIGEAERFQGIILKHSETPEECYICNTGKKLIRHHIKYKPEITIMICESCHDKIHTADWGWDGSEPYDEYTDYRSAYRVYVWYNRIERGEFYRFNERSAMRKLYCNQCERSTLVYPPDESRCSGCGRKYPEQLIEPQKENVFWDGERT